MQPPTTRITITNSAGVGTKQHKGEAITQEQCKQYTQSQLRLFSDKNKTEQNQRDGHQITLAPQPVMIYCASASVTLHFE
jgi:hypothetical protein